MPEDEFELDITYEKQDREHFSREDMEQHKRERMRENIITSIKQKLIGLSVIGATIVAIASGLTYDEITGCNDATFALLTIPMGLAMIFTHHRWLR